MRSLAMRFAFAARPAHLRLSQLIMTQRHFGIFSSVQEKIVSSTDGRRAAKQLEEFRRQMAHMASVPTFTFDEFIKLQEESLHKSGALGWRSKLPFARAQAQTDSEDRKVLLQVMKNFSPEECKRALDLSITKEDRDRISAASSVHISQVNVVLKQYYQMMSVATWLKQMKDAGRPLPSYPSAISEEMGAHPPKLSKALSTRLRQEQMTRRSRPRF
jgi:signal recognition particle GTPase